MDSNFKKNKKGLASGRFYPPPFATDTKLIIYLLTLSYTAINEIATFTAVDENGRCNNNGI